MKGKSYPSPIAYCPSPSLQLPRWMRIAMLATAVMNIFGAAVFTPAASGLRKLLGLPADEHPLYPAIIAAFIFIFGLAYLWAGLTGTADRSFIAVAAAGKLMFFGLLVWYWATGALPATVPLLGMGDLVFGVLFAAWLYSSRSVARR